MTRAALLILAATLGGCVSIVVVRSDGAPARVSAGIGGVRVIHAPGDALSVSQRTLGLSKTCGLIGVGYTAARCSVIPADSCGVAIVQSPPKSALPHWRWIADETVAHCLKGTPK